MSDLLPFLQSCNNDLLNGTSQDIDSARKYLLNDRKILEESIKCHTIGYCSKDIEIPDEVRFFGTMDKENKWDISSRVKGRIIVPIYSENGKAVAFATRVPTTEPGNPWWNLPSPFQKGNHLFLFDKAKKEIYTKNKLYIVEGYIDALMLYQHGLRNVSAIMGTAYTLRKLGLTARYCNNVCLCFDTDANEAGTKAKKMSIAILNKYSFCESISTIDGLPTGDDPASFVGREGIAKFLEMERVIDEEEIVRTCIEISKGKSGKLLDAK